MAVVKNLLNTSSSAAQTSNQQVQFIDLSDKPAQAKVVREGYQVPTPVFDPAKTDFLINNLVTATPTQLPRVISQSVPAGTKVAAGTVVDLILAPRESVPFSIFANVHADLAAQPITFVDTLLSDPNVRQILLSSDTSDQVSTADKTTLITAFTAAKITVNDTDPTRTFDEAFGAVRGALAFR